MFAESDTLSIREESYSVKQKDQNQLNINLTRHSVEYCNDRSDTSTRPQSRARSPLGCPLAAERCIEEYRSVLDAIRVRSPRLDPKVCQRGKPEKNEYGRAFTEIAQCQQMIDSLMKGEVNGLTTEKKEVQVCGAKQLEDLEA